MGRGLFKTVETLTRKGNGYYEEKRHLVKRRSDQSYRNCLIFRQPDSMNQILKSGVGPHIVIGWIHL
jgi:hypothetical protein